MQTNRLHSLRAARRMTFGVLLSSAFVAAVGAPPGPVPVVPEGGKAPGAFPNTSVSAVNVVARGSTTFSGAVDVPGFDGQGPIAWSLCRYNRGDFAMRLAPNDPVAAVNNLGLGFTEVTGTDPTQPPTHAWRPHQQLGLTIPTARQNGPIDWNDGEGPFFPTIAIATGSSGDGYSMVDGSFGAGDSDINTGRAGTHSASPEANFAFSVTWFPYDQGWMGGNVGEPTADGMTRWNQASSHSVGLTTNMVTWSGSLGAFGGLAELNIPGIDSRADGMLFAASSDGASDVNIVGVAPKDDGLGWIVTIREDSALSADEVASASQSEFEFVYVPYTAVNLVGGYIQGTDGSKIKSQGSFTLSRTAVGTYDLTIPGKQGKDGTLLLQVADVAAEASVPMASRAFLSYEYSPATGKFTIQSRQTTSDTTADLVDASFYVAWVDFANPLAPPAGPRFRSLPAALLTSEDMTISEANLAVNTDEPEVLVTVIDKVNARGFTDAGGVPYVMALMGYFVHPATLAPLGEPFLILGNPNGNGEVRRHDVKYNPVSKQYVVVANARAYNASGYDVPWMALVNPKSVAGDNDPVAKRFAYDENTELSYDDVSLAVSEKNGNFIIACEHKFSGEGEGVLGVLFDKTGTALTPATRLDQLEAVGDEDDPDICYLPLKDAFFFHVNIDHDNKAVAVKYTNRVTGTIVGTVPDGAGKLQLGTQQLLTAAPLEQLAEGHSAAIESPFTGEVLTAFDMGGNGVPRGALSYVTVGTGPTYPFTLSRPEAPYLTPVGNPAPTHAHPQMAADPGRGVIIIGFGSANAKAYLFRALGPDGAVLPSQLAQPYSLSDAPGGMDTGPNFHNIKYSPSTGSFIVAYGSGPAAYVTALQVTSDHLAPPELAISLSGQGVTMAWPASASGYHLWATDSLAPASWKQVTAPVVPQNGLNTVTLPATGGAQFYRLQQ